MKSKPIEVLLAPADNQRLANLCGALDENIRQIEAALDISIARRGERFTLRGSPGQTARGAELLQKFYADARRELTLDDIQLGLVEAQQPIDSEGDDAPTLLTRRADLHGRTPRQRGYLKSIFANDVTCAIGPAPLSCRDAHHLAPVRRALPVSELAERLGDTRARARRGAVGVAPDRDVRVLREGQHVRLDTLLEMSAGFQALAHKTKQHREAVMAFIEKRKPLFSDD